MKSPYANSEIIQNTTQRKQQKKIKTKQNNNKNEIENKNQNQKKKTKFKRLHINQCCLRDVSCDDSAGFKLRASSRTLGRTTYHLGFTGAASLAKPLKRQGRRVATGNANQRSQDQAGPSCFRGFSQQQQELKTTRSKRRLIWPLRIMLIR